MSKRLYLILIPIIALIISINGKWDTVSLFTSSTYADASITDVQYHLPYSIFLEKEHGRKIKNAIRPKARDCSSAIPLPAEWQFMPRTFYYIKQTHSSYYSPTYSLHISLHKLRGPPVA